MKMFAEDLVGFNAPPRIQQGRTAEVAENLGNFFKYEYLQFTILLPGFETGEGKGGVDCCDGQREEPEGLL